MALQTKKKWTVVISYIDGRPQQTLEAKSRSDARSKRDEWRKRTDVHRARIHTEPLREPPFVD